MECFGHALTRRRAYCAECWGIDRGLRDGLRVRGVMVQVAEGVTSEGTRFDRAVNERVESRDVFSCKPSSSLVSNAPMRRHKHFCMRYVPPEKRMDIQQPNKQYTSIPA